MLSTRWRWLSLLSAIPLHACTVGDEPPADLADAAALAGQDPCKDASLKARINVHKNADGTFVGTNGPDVIFGTNARDVIYGNGGDDVICAFGGDDYVDGGDGRDRIFAGAGDDIVHGRGGSDQIWGGPGADVLFGDILDDDLHGEAGNDILIGGHGTDLLDGGGDNDFLRGDTGNDTFLGGDGTDTASFATALPPGQPDTVIDGLHIKFDGTCKGGGCSDGDGGNEQLSGVERIYGSPFNDKIDAPGKDVDAGLGRDLLNGVATGAPTPVSTVFTQVARNPAGDVIDVGVEVLGSPQADKFTIVGSADNVRVDANHAITPGPGCTAITPASVRCAVGGNLHYVAGWGGNGEDVFQLQGTFPREFEAHVSGGEGTDHLIGGDEADVFFTGTSGADTLEGNAGDDALISESHHTDAWANDQRPPASQYTDGGDTLDGGSGNDQLVVDYVCGGHRFIGGSGHDIAGFARSGKPAITAQLGGPAKVKRDVWGYAANLALCPKQADWTKFVNTGEAADLETLEASDGADHLWGDDRNNVIWGRGGGDHIYGLDGDDEIRGADGTDVIDGGEGDDDISNGKP